MSEETASTPRTVAPLMPGDQVVIIGAGPAGLTAAYLLAKAGVKPIVLEADDIVGGISRTAQYKGFRFDIGGHRFFTKIEPVQALWEEILGDEFISVPRMSRIFYNGTFFDYPLKAANALKGLGPINAIMIMLSYLKWHYRPYLVEENFEQWVTNRFGKRLYEIFFKTYTEKVWGIPCTEIRAEWAAQRIQGLSLAKAISGAVARQSHPDGDVAQPPLDRHQDADPRVPLSTARPGPDVGALPRPHPRNGWTGADAAPRARYRAARRPCRCGACEHARRRSALRSRPCDFDGGRQVTDSWLAAD
jgi:protoporphyrinogen oxidase